MGGSVSAHTAAVERRRRHAGTVLVYEPGVPPGGRDRFRPADRTRQPPRPGPQRSPCRRGDARHDDERLHENLLHDSPLWPNSVVSHRGQAGRARSCLVWRWLQHAGREGVPRHRDKRTLTSRPAHSRTAGEYCFGLAIAPTLPKDGAHEKHGAVHRTRKA